MPPINPDDLERIDQEIRINELRHEAEELAGGAMAGFESPDCPPGIAEKFWRHVVAYEKAPLTTHFQQLLDAGVAMPAPASLDDAQTTAKLWEVIRRLGERRVFLSTTNHLSDRELYANLWGDGLREATPELEWDENSAWHIDLLSSGSDEDTTLYLRHFADEEWRRRWQESFPDFVVPPHEDPPFDRDRHLPRATYGRPTGDEGP